MADGARGLLLQGALDDVPNFIIRIALILAHLEAPWPSAARYSRLAWLVVARSRYSHSRTGSIPGKTLLVAASRYCSAQSTCMKMRPLRQNQTSGTPSLRIPPEVQTTSIARCGRRASGSLPNT